MNQTVGIREALQTDFEFVASLMESALAPFYGGDHRAHARRIFDAHVAGGQDTVGHFSAEQIMFIAEVGGVPAGVIHIVGKKQHTYKISPLIVHPDFRGGYGVGSVLLRHAEEYALAHGAKQMYCTVAQENLGAMQFFRRNGYVVGGHSINHYKAGIAEVMLYKLFVSDEVLSQLDELSISVVPFDEEQHAEPVRELILSILPQYFDGVDDAWVDSLFAGWHRRDSLDINQKYKLIYVATESGRVVGVAGATPKKGEPIKLMPLVAAYPAAFMALLSDVPQHLKEYGRKLYTHIVPSVEQVMILQRLGWSLDCMLPAAYHDEYTTQQWSFSYGEDYMRNMRVKARFYRLIQERKKTLEVRVGYDSIKKIQAGEQILLGTHDQEMVIRVNAVRIYKTFADMLEHEDVNRIAPGMSKAELLKLLRKFYPPFKEKLGVYVLEVEPDDSSTK